MDNQCIVSLQEHTCEATDLIAASSNKDDLFFDSVVGHIEDILMDNAFIDLQKCFMEKHWKAFDDDDENKLCYMEIFKEYNGVIEHYIESRLMSEMANFSMDTFIKQLEMRKHELDGEVFEMLYTFSDFLAFKEMFLDYKAFKEGTVQDLSRNIFVTAGNSHNEI